MAESAIKNVIEIKNDIDLHGGDYDLWYIGRVDHPEEDLVDGPLHMANRNMRR